MAAKQKPVSGEEGEEKPAAKPKEKWHVRLTSRGSFFVFFLMGLTVGIGFALWALSEHLRQMYPTLFIGTYESGRVRAKNQVEDAFGWGSELLVDKKPGAPAAVRFMLRDKSKRPITGAKVIAVFTDKEDGTRSFSFTLQAAEPGVYRAEAALPGPALWSVHVGALISETAYQTSEEMRLP